MKHYWITILSLLYVNHLQGQSTCNFDGLNPLSQRLANYVMEVELDHQKKTAVGTQHIEWVNNGPEPVGHVEMYMYLNAFKDVKSSYIAGSINNVMGQDLSNKPAEDWGYIRLESIRSGESSHEMDRYYIQNLDGNTDDQSVIKIELTEPVLPGDTLHLKTRFVSKLPRTIARVGFAENDFHFFVHWYPKLGVYEPNSSGVWGWNCHQFLQRMEFYGEFGTYDMTITTDKNMTVGASGCRIDRVALEGDKVRHHFMANDVIDFAWVAYPDFEVYEDNWRGVDIELLYPKHHKRLVKRIVGAVKNSLEYLDDHVGPYPYPKITVMDPPALGMRSGFMEYPTFITGGSFYGFPNGVKTLESLIVHEFSHQYFMGMLANNEKEAPWLDEGFVTFFEDNIMEAYYGQETSLFDFFGYKLSNSAKSRNEYVSLSNKRISHITNNSWKIRGNYKGIIYSKTSLVLRSMMKVMGEEVFFNMMRSYYEDQKFTHPRKEDFVSKVTAYSKDVNSMQKQQLEALLWQGLDSTVVCDFSVSDVQVKELEGGYESVITIEQLQDFVIPVDILFTYADGTNTTKIWSGEGRSNKFVLPGVSPISTVQIDPMNKLFIDINVNNNSYTSSNSNMTTIKYLARTIYWAQNAMQSLSFLM